ncbi:MAG: hypothetical protein ABW185_24260 [Sedimenticola sp.]
MSPWVFIPRPLDDVELDVGHSWDRMQVRLGDLGPDHHIWSDD